MRYTIPQPTLRDRLEPRVTPGSPSLLSIDNLEDIFLDDLSDVTASSPSPGDILTWDGNKWIADSVGRFINHNDLDGLNEGDYLHLTAAEYVSLGTVITLGTARQLLQVNAGATAAEWTSNVDIPGTLDVTGAAVFDSTVVINTISAGLGGGLVATNTVFGKGAMAAVASGGNNVAIGNTALAALTTGFGNVVVGDSAAPLLTTGFRNIFIGNRAGQNGVIASPDAVVGSNNIVIGFQAGRVITNAMNNVIVGGTAGTAVTIAQNLVLLGQQAGQALTTGSSNILIGYLAGAALTTTDYNTFVGHNAGALTAGTGTEATGNAGFGSSAMNFNTTGKNNTAIGGDEALLDNTIGSNNVAVGTEALKGGVSGDNNVGVGRGTGMTLTPANANVSGSQNVWIGNFSGPGTTSQLSNAIAIGYGALNSASNEVVLGNTSITSTVLRGAITGPTTLTMGGNLTNDVAKPAALLVFSLQNSSTATSANGSRFRLGASGENNTGDVYFTFVSKDGGASEVQWSFGIDTSASQALVLARSSSLGTSNVISIVPSTISTGYDLTLSGGTSVLSFSSATGVKTISTGGSTDLALSPGSKKILYVSTGILDWGAGNYTLTHATGLLTASGVFAFGAQARLKGYTVATLPATPVQGDVVFVTDALLPAFLAVVAGGGAVVTTVLYNGAAWVTV